MKRIYFAIMALLAFQEIYAQIVNIPDENFKKALLEYDPIIDINNDGDIQFEEAEIVEELLLWQKGISSIDGVEAFINLKKINIFQNNVANIDLSNNLKLAHLDVRENKLKILEVEKNVQLEKMFCDGNELSELDLSKNLLINYLSCGRNLIKVLDLNLNTKLDYLSIHNGILEQLYIKNGQKSSLNGCDSSLYISGNPNLSFICIDEEEIECTQSLVDNLGLDNCVVSSYCSFDPGGDFYTVKGNIKYDAENDGCSKENPYYRGLVKFEVTDDNKKYFFGSKKSGEYRIPFTNDGKYEIKPILENSSYFNVSPELIEVDFPSDISPFEKNFCITPNGSHNDLEIKILPINSARPGVEAKYRIVYWNKGNQVISGSLSLSYEGELMKLLSSTPSVDKERPNNLTWNYTDLEPFEVRSIQLLMDLNKPSDTPPLNEGDILNFVGVIGPIEDDETSNDNVDTFSQVVVNSMDPNDITCLQGNWILPGKVGDYVHYLIRFENTGNAEAINIVIKDRIDPSKFNIGSIIPLHSSHDYILKISNENEVEFIFENINLPANPSENKGYLLFKIKTSKGLELGDKFENEADIYFDFNFPITTNKVETIVDEPQSVVYNNFSNGKLRVYPNPSNGKLTIVHEEPIEVVSIFNLTGKSLYHENVEGLMKSLNLELNGFSQGSYIVRVKSSKKNYFKRLILN